MAVVVLPERIQERISVMGESHMGVHRVTVELRDGRVYSGVEVAWVSEVIRVAGHAEIPFTGEEVIDVFDETA